MFDEINAAVSQALANLSSNASWRTYTGVQQQQLSQTLGHLLGTHHVGLTCSGTVALELLLRACRLEPDQEVLLAGYDYPGNFAAIERVGARPAVVDVSPGSWRLDWDSLNATYTPQCRVLIASHLHGQLQEIGQLQAWCRQRGVWLIQDACQALGASIEGEPLGQAADATFVSFGGSKTISAGRGGAWVTNDEGLAQYARLAAGVGSGGLMMSELQAAVVLAQLPFLSRITEQTRAYFGGMLERVSREQPGSHAPWASDLPNTAFYQAGWIVRAGTGESWEIPSGKGFDGFHRRSSRRCRLAAPLINTASVAEQTRTIHFRAALVFEPHSASQSKIIPPHG